LAFLNPDGTLVDFLVAGAKGLEGDMQDVLAEPNRFYEALGEAERFSLIVRQVDANEQRITIHRLVQSVIKDEMSQEQLAATTTGIIKLCDSAFPDVDHYAYRETGLLSRKFEDQVLVPLSSL
jgi:hypothetical protein